MPPRSTTLDRKTIQSLSLPAKVRLRWRLRARPKQLTPGRHHLCDNEPATCKSLIAEAHRLFPRRTTESSAERIATYLEEHPDLADTIDEDEDPRDHVFAHWLAQRGHWDWLIWLILAGRGWGKTRTGAEDVVKFALENPKARIALVAATFADGRDTMVEGESGIINILPPSLVDDWNRSIGELVLTNGSRMKIFSSEKPERLRGPQHHRAWADELAAWEYLQDTWDMMMFGLRLGENPQVIITTTPKPLKFIRNLIARSKNPEGGVVVTSGSTYENAKNLARAMLQELKETYEGTRLGRQELRAEVLDDVEGALFSQSDINDARLAPYLVPDVHQITRNIVVAVDPAVTSNPDSDATGIITIAKTDGPCPFCHKAEVPHAIVLADSTSKGTPGEWANKVVNIYDEWFATKIVAEKNNGGELVAVNIGTVRQGLPVDLVWASKGKVVRAEPVAALYQQGKVHHLGKGFADLEEEMTTWDPENTKDDSPNRMDALVWGITDLMLPSKKNRGPVRQAVDRRGRGRR